MGESHDALLLVQLEKAAAPGHHVVYVRQEAAFSESFLPVMDGYDFSHFQQGQRSSGGCCPEEHHRCDAFFLVAEDPS